MHQDERVRIIILFEKKPKQRQFQFYLCTAIFIAQKFNRHFAMIFVFPFIRCIKFVCCQCIDFRPISDGCRSMLANTTTYNNDNVS